MTGGIVVVGLGNIGHAIANRLVSCGRPVQGVDLDEGRRRLWREETGLDAAASVADVHWDDVTHVFVLVRLTEQAAAVLDELGDLPIADGLTVFLLTTLEVDFARDLGRYDGGRFRLVELPVSGGESGARAGQLTVLPAGPMEDADVALLTDTIAGNVVRFERYGDPTVVKLLNNVTAAYNARALADVLVLGTELGIDPARLYDVLVVSSGGSWMASAFRALVDDLLDKDVALLRQELGSLPVISLDAEADLPGRLAEARALLSERTS